MTKRICRRWPTGVLLFLTAAWLSLLFTPSAARAQTALGKLAASMKPGTWALLNSDNDGSGFGQALLDAGTSHTITEWTDKAVWDPVSRKFFFRGQGHYADEKFISYDDTTGKWSVVQKFGSGIGHAYETNAINPSAREVYYRRYGSNRTVEKYNITTGTWTSLPSNGQIGYVECCVSLEYFPERNSLIWVNGTEFSPPLGGVYEYQLATGQWSKVGDYPMGKYNTFASYNPIYKVIVFGGGDNNTRAIHKMDQTGKVTRLKDAPVDLGVYYSVTTVDPASGRYLVMSTNKNFYEYDISTDTWKILSGPVPAFTSKSNPVFDVIATPVSTYGVVMFVKAEFQNTSVYLYKHSSGSGTPLPFDFSVSNGGNKSVAPGQATSNTITATLVSGTTQTAGFSVSGLPSGASGTFTQTSCAPTCSTTLNVSTVSTTPTGNHTVTVTAVAGSLTKSTAFTLAVNATTPPPVGSSDFQTRCSEAGVVKCVGFDQASDIAGTYGNNSGITCGASCPTIDSSVMASGNSSLKFTIPSNSGSDTSGSYFTNFSSDLSIQFGENSEFYVQWRQRFSVELLTTPYTGSQGFKQTIINTGDKPGKLYASCTANHLVTNQYYQYGFPVMYNSCTGSASHGAYDGFYERISGDWKLQNGRPSPYCLLSQVNAGKQFPPTGNCFGYFPNEWMTYQVMVKTGPRVNDEFTNSYVRVWIAREGQPSELVINWGPYNLSAGPTAEDQKYGKVWLLPYQTGKSSTQSHPTAYTWYDELIISRTKIADPASSGGTATTAPAAPTALVVK